ncbi:MAG: hypothetical protein WDZ48_06305 [Pirellulales bacterium]
MTDAARAILEQVQRLSATEQEELLTELLRVLNHSKAAPKRHSILELEGLGKEIWSGIDAQEYVDRERDSWNG